MCTQWQSRGDYTVVQSLHLHLVNTAVQQSLSKTCHKDVAESDKHVKARAWMAKKEENKLSWSNLVDVEFAVCLLSVFVLYWGIPFVKMVVHPFIVSFSSGSSLLLFSSCCSDRALLPECLLESSCLSTSFSCRDDFIDYHQSSELISKTLCLYSDIHIISYPRIYSENFLDQIQISQRFHLFLSFELLAIPCRDWTECLLTLLKTVKLACLANKSPK